MKFQKRLSMGTDRKLKSAGYTLIELLLGIMILSLCIGAGILKMNNFGIFNSEHYAERLIRDMHLYNEKSHILKARYSIELEKNGYIIKDEGYNTIVRRDFPSHIIIDSNIMEGCISFDKSNIIINNTGSIDILDLQNEKQFKITIIPTTGRMTLKRLNV